MIAKRIGQLIPLIFALLLPSLHGMAQTPTPPIASLVGAGDIAVCSMTGDEQTADLVETMLGGENTWVFTVGDNVYQSGTAEEYTDCYGPSWGRFKKRTYPALGNHEYGTPGAKPTFAYFVGRMGLNNGYYSYTLGNWLVVVLNSNIDARQKESYQSQWLEAEIAAYQAKKLGQSCILAYWHHPLVASTSKPYTDRPRDIAAIWQVLYAHGAEIVLNGHVHTYERFALLDPAGQPDPRGIRQFIVGTGGATLNKNTDGSRAPHSEFYTNQHWGVLRLDLYADSYQWAFHAVGQTAPLDTGSGDCSP
jgi:acid phosphatase type 7